ncbi:hypothetical protein [Streptomyces sp. HC307]
MRRLAAGAVEVRTAGSAPGADIAPSLPSCGGCSPNRAWTWARSSPSR